jgi:hypothetical protein
MRLRVLLAVLTLALVGPLAAQVTGSGVANYVPLWTGTTSVGNSFIVQSGGNVGINKITPTATLDVLGRPGASGKTGSPLQFISGVGGSFLSAHGGLGAVLLVTGGSPGYCFATSTRCGGYIGGNGGSITLQPGLGGSGTFMNGHPGFLMLAPNGGRVGIGTSTPSVAFEVGAGHATLADAWATRSSRRFKSNIQPLLGALSKIQQLQGVSYDQKTDGQHEIGVIAEDVDRVVPEVITRNPETREIEGLDYSRLVALLIEAVKTQQDEIQRLQESVHVIHSREGH